MAAFRFPKEMKMLKDEFMYCDTDARSIIYRVPPSISNDNNSL